MNGGGDPTHWRGYPWVVAPNNYYGNRPADLVAAWRHIHDRFLQAGAWNVRWVFNPDCDLRWQALPSAAYPGDDVVDFIGWDTYGGCAQTPQDDYNYMNAYNPTKPMLLGEVGATSPAWVQQWNDGLGAGRMPRVRGLVWFDEGKTLLENNPDLAAAVRNLVGLATSHGVAPVQVGPPARSYTPTVTLQLPAPSQAGTLLVATLANDGWATFTAGAAGWTKGPSQANWNTRAEIWYYPNNPGNITSATFSAASGSAVSGALSEWSGVATTAPLDGSGAISAGSAASLTVTTVAPASGALAITAYAAIQSGGGRLAVTPAAWDPLARDSTADWFHFGADSTVGAPAGWVRATEQAAAPLDWSAVVASFKAR
jgi:hypothetical protein